MDTKDFFEREDRYLSKISVLGGKLPERLLNWRIWIQDPVIYISELHNFLEDLEKI